MRQNCDLECCQNNGVVAIRPSETGMLAPLVKKTKTHELPDAFGDYGGHQRVWVFCDVDVWNDGVGNERMNHHRMGIRNGTYQDGRAFIEMCRKLGLSVEDCGFFVPFSNGERRYAAQSSDGQPLTDYDEGELQLMRWDLPTRDQLVALLGLKTVDRRGGTGHFPGVEQ